MYAWAQIKPTGKILDAGKAWSSLGVHFRAADADRFEEAAAVTLEKQRPVHWHAVSGSQGLAWLHQQRNKFSVAPGVDPLLIALLLAEEGAYEYEAGPDGIYSQGMGQMGVRGL